MSRPDKGYSLVDASSFAIMNRMGIKQALATDDHFRQEGFEVVPG